MAVGRSDEERKFINYRKVIIEVPLILYLEVIQYGFVFVLCGETGVGQVAVGLSPMLDAAVVVQTQVFCNDEWCNGRLQALPEQEQSPHPAIAVLERMNALELHMEIKDMLQLNRLVLIILRQ